MPDISLPDSNSEFEVEPATVAAALKSEPSLSFRLIDCREEGEYALCKLPHSELIPLGQFPEAASAQLPDRDEAIVIYCHHGVRSLHATHALRQQGYPRVFSMRGGIDAWSTEVNPSTLRY